METSSSKKKIVIIVMTGNMLVDFAGPSDVFTQADNYLMQSTPQQVPPSGYEVLITAPTMDRTIKTQTGVEIHCPYHAMEINFPVDTIIIAGNNFNQNNDTALESFYKWLVATYKKEGVRRIASVCGGAFVLAKAGLLEGKKATTHWELSEKLKRSYPGIQVHANQFFVNDGNIYTSAGVSSGIDLALALVEQDFGKETAIHVARKLVFYLSRPGFQAQFGHLLPVYESVNIAGKIQKWLQDHLHESLEVSRIAAKVNMSTRNFTRVFHKETGMPPAKFVEKLRVEAARRFLEQTNTPLERIAEKCGLGNLVSMRRVFLRHLSVTPSDYRRVFRTALKDPAMEDVLYET